MQPSRIPDRVDMSPDVFRRFVDEVSAKYGACQEALDWSATHDWPDMLDDTIKDPYPPAWGFWTYMNCAQHGDAQVRMILLQSACKSAFFASQIWLKADHATPEERAYAYGIATAEYVELKKQAERGEITAGSKAHEWEKAVPVAEVRGG